jgi:hypothetical protein
MCLGLCVLEWILPRTVLASVELLPLWAVVVVVLECTPAQACHLSALREVPSQWPVNPVCPLRSSRTLTTGILRALPPQ